LIARNASLVVRYLSFRRRLSSSLIV
jgi:hypothetical protein